jgi:hypothetical protein
MQKHGVTISSNAQKSERRITAGKDSVTVQGYALDSMRPPAVTA